MEPIIARLRSGHDHRRSPFAATAAKRVTLRAKNNAILKLSVVASVLLASSGAGYYYFVYLPQREVQFEPQRVLEIFRAASVLNVPSRNCRFSNKTYRNNERRNKKSQRSGKPWRRRTAIKRV